MRLGQDEIIFSRKWLWQTDPETLGGYRGKLLRAVQVVVFIMQNFLTNSAPLRAAALTFTTLLSIVPLLALTFAVLKGLGAQNKLAPVILRQVAAGSEVVVTRIVTYINNTNAGSIGAIGLLMLLFTAVSTLGSVEDSFDTIWGVPETRSFYRKFSDYLSVLVSAPLLVLAATSITSTLQNKAVVRWLLESTYFGDIYLQLLRLVPYVSVWAAFFLLYIFIPNTKVRVGSALFGAVLAGTIWEGAQWAYIHFQIGVANYNAIYGTLAALPIVMIWLYTSWLIVLFGMEVVAVHQQRTTFRRELLGHQVNQSFRELLALAVLRRIGESFHHGQLRWGEQQLSLSLGIPLRILRPTLNQLSEAGFIVSTSAPGEPYQPARELDQIVLAEVILSLKSQGACCLLPGEEAAAGLLERGEEALREAFKGTTLKELVLENEAAAVVDKGGSVDI
ncbi:YihY family inner membrane protein [Geomonas sp. RF6]|uniref:YhjD/YihY/BrkB family envelope integrity protein n=1 Tax=Geomonas sp. RF6 TaxID=2897342 RepID=UPI001E436CEE|nr:YhjD/YihY/BrkB family envelope integrity protein [Geomonas sp. RF6]UFS71607.1 YihY family inner membrane protein [Geomonas sp. RF6]